MPRRVGRISRLALCRPGQPNRGRPPGGSSGLPAPGLLCPRALRLGPGCCGWGTVPLGPAVPRFRGSLAGPWRRPGPGADIGQKHRHDARIPQWVPFREAAKSVLLPSHKEGTRQPGEGWFATTCNSGSGLGPRGCRLHAHGCTPAASSEPPQQSPHGRPPCRDRADSAALHQAQEVSGLHARQSGFKSRDAVPHARKALLGPELA